MNIKRGDIYYADLSPVVGSEQGGVRPVLIIQNDVGNRYSPTVIAAAITSRSTKANLPTHIKLFANESGLAKDSVVLLEQITWEPSAVAKWEGSTPHFQSASVLAATRLHSEFHYHVAKYFISNGRKFNG